MQLIQKINHCIFSLQKKIYYLLDPDSDFWYSKIANAFIALVIAVNVISVILSSEPNIDQEFRTFLTRIEHFSLVIFTIEYLLRFWSAPADSENQGFTPSQARWRYSISFFGIIDLVAILPFVLSFFIAHTQALRIIRLFRVFKWMRYNAAMKTLLTVIKEEAKDLISVIFLMAILLILASSGIYLFEHQAQPEHFGSILRSMWWAIVTISTVGYGDTVPITVAGRVFAGLIMVASIGVVALPAGILASAFSEQLGRHKTQYRNAVQAVLSKSFDVSNEDRHILKSIQNRCNLSNQDAHSIYNEVLNTLRHHQQQQAQTQAMQDMLNTVNARQSITSSATPSTTGHYCTQCGEKVQNSDQYCGQCGNKLS